MAQTKEDAIKRARVDLAARLGVKGDEIREESVEAADFPDLTLGAPTDDDEIGADMIASGWVIRLTAKNRTYEYRADRNQLRLYDYDGSNYLVS